LKHSPPQNQLLDSFIVSIINDSYFK
jgi:hypothetical protein